jgi:hypothetical protein
MPNWDSIEQSFLSLSRQKQLGELASSLARLKSWSLTEAAQASTKGSANKVIIPDCWECG